MAPERIMDKTAATNALRTAIAKAGISCNALIGGLGVRIDDYTVHVPDALAYCADKLPPHTMVVPNPVIVVEVVSPTTRHTDNSAKLFGYFKLPSVHHCLIIDPEARTVTHHARAADGTVSGRTLTDEELDITPPGIKGLGSAGVRIVAL